MAAASISNPFPGLRPFGFEDAPFYFGRKSQVDKLHAKLNFHRFIAVVGRSGDGKSSLVKAGLLPKLAKETNDVGEQHWLFDEMQPQGTPIIELAGLVDRLLLSVSEHAERVPAEIRLSRTLAALRRSSRGLAELLAEAMRGRTSGVLIVVDQFEELFRFDRSGSRSKDFEEAAAFVDLLLRASRVDSPKVHVALTMRSDFLGDCPLFRDLPEAINDSQFLVPRLTRPERRGVIEGPIHKAGAEIEPVLVQRLLNDVGDAPDMLPVLQHALMRTWQSARQSWTENARHVVESHHYDSSGGVDKALSNHADRTYKELGDKKQRVAETLFKALVDIDYEGRRTRRTPAPTFADLVALCDQDEKRTAEVVDAFRAPGRCFLVPSAERDLEAGTYIDISHEALVRRWRKFDKWLDSEQTDGRNYRSLVEAVVARSPYLTGMVAKSRVEWFDGCKPGPEWAKRYGGRFVEVRDLITRSRKQLRRDRFLRFLPYFASAAIGLAIVGFVIANQRAEIIKEVKEANELAGQRLMELEVATSSLKIELAQGIAVQAEELLRRGDARLALRVAREALTAAEEPLRLPILQAVGYAAMTSPWPLLELTRNQDAVATAAFSPDGSRVATASADSTALIWDADSGRLIATLRGHRRAVNSAAFSPDGTRIVTAGKDDTVRVWDAATGDVIRVFKQRREAFTSAAYTSAAYSPDGTRVVATSTDSTVLIWDVKTGRVTTRFLGHIGAVKSAAFSPDGTRIVTAGEDKTARLWDADTGEEIAVLFGHREPVNWAVFSPDGTRVVTAADDGTARIWDVETGVRIALLFGDQGPVNSASFSPDGTRVVTAADDGTARIWDAESGASIALVAAREGALVSAVFSPDGARIATTSSGGATILWRSSPPITPMLLARNTSEEVPAWIEPLRKVSPRRRSFSEAPPPTEFLGPDGRRAEVAQWSGGTVLILTNRTGGVEAEFVIPPESGAMIDVKFVSTARRVLAVSDNLALWQASGSVAEGTQGLVTSPIARFGETDDLFLAAAISPDGSSVGGLLSNRHIRIWPVFQDVTDFVAFIDTLNLTRLNAEEQCRFGLLPDSECLAAANR